MEFTHYNFCYYIIRINNVNSIFLLRYYFRESNKTIDTRHL